MPDPLVSSQQFTVDFFVIDPASQLLNVTQAVSVRVLRESDGAIHPNAQITPSTGQMVGGHLRLTITITATTSLTGYTLGLGPGGMSLLSLTAFLKTAFNISTNISTTTSNGLYQALENLRTSSIDPNPVWAYPLSGADYPIAGTFGEWRGNNNTRIHAGIDLAAPGNTRVLASRGGVISRKGVVSSACNMGEYLVIDHGGGWFSRYLHVSPASIAVKVGQAVTRGQTLATNLLTGGCIGTHLHFEIRRTNNISQWDIGSPGASQDPLQIATINPGSGIFTVPLGSRAPELEEFGLTSKSPGQEPFVKPTTTIPEPTGSVFIYARFLDRESKTPSQDCDGSFYRLSLRAMGFQPEGVATTNWIWPSNEVAIAAYLPAASSGKTNGFAKYKIPPNPQRCEYYRYWWKWDISNYTNATGPRSNVLTGVDYGGASTNYIFTFGPKIIGNVISNQGQWTFTNVAYLGTNPPVLTQPDRYKVEIIQTNGVVLSGVTWGNPITSTPSGELTPILTTHLQTNVYTFTLPVGANVTGLKLRVSSVLAAPIAHEMELLPSLTIMARTGQDGLSGIGANIAINQEGVIAFTGSDASGSAPFAVADPHVINSLGLIRGRTYSGVGITSGANPLVLARELVPGPSYIVRSWDIATEIGTILGSSTTSSGPKDFDSASGNLDFNLISAVEGVGKRVIG